MKTKISAIAGAVLMVIALQACKHPLAIEGEGDIVDAGNSGHGCTLEQFQAKHPACTENEISGDYFVNYKAEPRPGWRFVRWDGPCSPNSDFQHCRLGVNKSTVEWWDETYPDLDIPPSTAVFAPITGNTGFLAGPAVAGVAWETPTQQGVTGLDGSFQYRDGETVRFMIGDTELGKVTGREQVTPFELAGSAVVTGTSIAGVLEDDPFVHAINIAVLLQSLDHDGDPGNGIQIRSGVAALFRGVSLNVTQRWESFRNESTLRHALGRANIQHRFSRPHGIVRPAVAAAVLYAALEIDARTFGLSRGQDEDSDGNPGHTERYQYGANGNLARHDDGTPDQFENWQYGANGNLTRHERDAEKYGYRSIQTWQYEINGNLVRFVEDNGADGTPDQASSYEYDAYGKVTLEDHYEARGEFPERHTVRRQYDARGNLTRAELRNDGEEAPYRIETWRYGANGKVTWHKSAETFGDSFSIEQYDTNGNLTRSEQYFYLDTEYNSHSITSYAYDEFGNLTRVEEDNDADGNPDIIAEWHYQYDISGNLTRRESVHSNDTSAYTLETWQYDASGKITRYECSGRCGEIGTDIERLPEGFRDHRVESWQYHANGNVRLHEIEVTAQQFEGGTITGSNRATYSPNGELISYEIAEAGTNIRSMSWHYSDGNLIRAEEDSNADGRRDRIETWQYDGDGKVTRYELDENGDGAFETARTYRYVATGWGHFFPESGTIGLFSSIPGKPQPSVP